MKKKIRIAFTGGGSGGHMYPLISVVENIKLLTRNIKNPNKELNFYYLGPKGIHLKDLIKNDVKIINIPGFKWRRYFSLKNIIDLIKFPFILCLSLLKMFFIMPDLLFSKGGTASFPIVLSAWFFKIPIFIHESDSIPGLSNKFAYKFAKRVGVSFEYTKKNIWKSDKVKIVGNPIRPFFLSPPEYGYDNSKAKRLLGFNPNIPLLIIIGGSLGSQRINEFILDNIEEIVSKYQILHITGPNNFNSFRAELAVAEDGLLKEQRNRYKIVEYLNKEIKDVMIASDLIISRAGSGAIFEMAYFGKPSILIPLKESAGNHQFYNALEYYKHGGCIIIEEDNLSKNIFFDQVKKILTDKNIYKKLSESAKKFSKPNAGELISKEILNIVQYYI